MATLRNIQGMLLEEVVLFLLETSGYRIVTTHLGDPTLSQHSAGLAVSGRGGKHQIDAIADYAIQAPFGHPSRLLVEAKFSVGPIGLPVIRNLVGVLKDVNEFWATSLVKNIPTKRFHYLVAAISSSGFTKDAQLYAFAQDIYLIPLPKSRFFQSILRAIRAIRYQALGGTSDRDIPIDMSKARQLFRMRLRNEEGVDTSGLESFDATTNGVMSECRKVRHAVVLMLDKQIPLFLIPNPEADPASLFRNQRIRVYYNADEWFLTDEDDRQLFSFDLPKELLLEFEHERARTGGDVPELKERHLSVLEAVVIVESKPQVIRFSIDGDWIDEIKKKIEGRT